MAGTEENPIIYPDLVMPDNVERQTITIWCQGLALDADLYRPIGLAADQKVPGIVLSHGMGGDKLTAERYAALFASVGRICISFSQPSWGDSHGRLSIVGDAPALDENGESVVKVKMARNLIDPLDWVDAFRAALDYLEGEPHVDAERIGAWGTSFGGGTALSAAALDDRIKTLAIQVPAVFNPPPEMKQFGSARARQIARGETPPIPDGAPDLMPGLPGTVNYARMAQYTVGDLVDQVSVPTLILDAANEEMFDITQSGGRAYKNLTARGVDAYYEVLPDIDHYGIYFGGYERGSQLAQDWFEKYL